MTKLPPLDLKALFQAQPHELADRLTLAFALERPKLLRVVKRPRPPETTRG